MFGASISLTNEAAFQKSLEGILANSRRPLEKVMHDQAKGLVGKIIQNTPPFSSRKRGNVAKAAAKKRIATQINRTLEGVHAKRADATTESALRAAHESVRVQGVVKRRVKSRVRVPKGKLKAYIKRRQAKIGMLAAGWNKAADKFGVSARMRPAWVKKHRPNSAASVKVSASSIVIRFSNKVRFGEAVDLMDRRMKSSIRWQARANNKKLAHYLGKALKKGSRNAGWKVG